MKYFFAVLMQLSVLSAYSQYQNYSPLTLEEIMKGNDFIGHSPESPFWSIDGDTVFYYQAIKNGVPNRLMAYVPANDSIVELGYIAARSVRRVPSSFSKSDSKMEVILLNRGVYVWEPRTSELQLLSDDASDWRNFSLGNDGKSIFYAKGNDWYRMTLPMGTTVRLTKILSAELPDKNQKKATWIENEELMLFDFLRDKKEVRDSMKNLSEDYIAQFKGPKNIYIGKANYNPIAITPEGTHAFYTISNRANIQNTNVPEWIPEDGFVNMLNARPKVGTPSSGHALLMIDLGAQDTFKIDFSGLPGIYSKPDFLQEYHNDSIPYEPSYTKPKPVSIGAIQCSYDGSVIIADLFSADNKDRWIIRIDLDNKSVECVDHQHDEAWIGGPGIRSWGSSKSIGFIGETNVLYFKSEESGFSHLYTYDFNTNNKKQHTVGDFEVRDVRLSRDHSKFYLQMNKDDAGIYHWFRYDLVDETFDQLTNLPGKWDLFMDPFEKSFAALYSSANAPTELYFLKDGIEWKKVTKSTTTSFDAYSWREPRYIQFEAEDGTMVPARLYEPETTNKNNAAVIFVHGAGYLQNAHKYWSTYYREYMFHNFLADNGYTVLDIDYRGSAGYGRDWRTAIYRHMGGLDLTDHVDGAKFLIEKLGISSDKVGLYGGSYGGFITLMAMFKHPEVFAAGAALRSVTDWAHYNHGYTSNILNTPESDSEAYRRSSPIYFAEGLQGNLLILHGMVDTNVHFQDVVRLAQRLIELEKDNWEMAVYPIEDHGFTNFKSWLDEYKRIYKLFETTLK